MTSKEEKLHRHSKILWELQKFAYEIDDHLFDAFLKEVKTLHEVYIQPAKDRLNGRSRN